MTDYPGLTTWRLTGEHGQSSLAIANRLQFATVATHTAHPYDPDDFRRCELLLRAAPTMRRDLHRMADVSDEWAALVPHWDLLVAAMEAEIPGVFDGPARGRAPVTYALIQHLTQDDAPAWFAALEAAHGAAREVPRMPHVDHTRIDPITELRMIRPDAEVIVVNVTEEAPNA